MSELGEFEHDESRALPTPDGREINLNDELDRPTSGEPSPEMQKYSEQFAYNIRLVVEARDKAARAMVVLGQADSYKHAYDDCVLTEQLVIEQEIDGPAKYSQTPLDYEDLDWELDKIQDAETYFVPSPDKFIREERILDGTSVTVRTFTYSVSDGWIFQEIENGTDEPIEDDEIDLDDEEASEVLTRSLAEPRDGSTLDPAEQLVLMDHEDNSDLDTRPLTAKEATKLAAVTSRLRDAIILRYRSKGLLAASKY